MTARSCFWKIPAFNEGEEINDRDFAKALAANGDILRQ